MSLLPRPQAQRALGQNFLIDQNIIRKIIAAIHPLAEETIYEIGPGPGALTEPLLAANANVHVIEKDRDMAQKLAQTPAAEAGMLTVIQADAVTHDWRQVSNTKIVGNLPYNVGTQIIFNLLPHLARLVKPATFMLQKEVAERIIATPGNKNWGKLGLWCRMYADCELLFIVPPTAFVPKPKVESAIIQLTPLNAPRYPHDAKKLKRVIDAAFTQRRKMLRASLKGVVDEAGFNAAGIDSTARPESLSLAEFCLLSQHLK
jgi:16S rRNA (adenine1518-N6/adenine1519-N6)-dimethyltransferase